jgi:hypothetical protein
MYQTFQFFKASALLWHYQIAAKVFVHSNGQMSDVKCAWPSTCFKHVSLEDRICRLDPLVVHSVQLSIYLICPNRVLPVTTISYCAY